MLIYLFEISNSKEMVWTEIKEHSVRIVDCDKFPTKEQVKEIIDNIFLVVVEEGYEIKRSKKDMCGELYLHIIFAKLGIAYKSAKDADLEYDRDPRWYVRLGSKILSILF